MILRRYVPDVPLREHIDFFWFYQDWQGDHSLEHVLPDGTFELVINLRESPRRLLRRGGRAEERLFRRGWLSGAHSNYIVIDAQRGASMIGAHFKPGGIAPWVGAAGEYRDQVVEFDALWGKAADHLLEQLLEANGATQKFEVLEGFLKQKLKPQRNDSRWASRIKFATDQFRRDADVPGIQAVADRLGLTHKHFIHKFRTAVGLTPKLFCRIQRFQQVLKRINSGQAVSWAEVACTCGYYDQAHFINDFKEFAGINPSAYLCLDPSYSNFVPVHPLRA